MTNNFMYRPDLMESRETRKINIDKAIGDMLAFNRTVAIKVLNFLDSNPIDGYQILGNELPKILTKEEYEKKTVQVLHHISTSSQAEVNTEVQRVKEKIKGIRIGQLKEIEDSIGELQTKKIKLLKKIGYTLDTSDNTDQSIPIQDSLEGDGEQVDPIGETNSIGSDLATFDMGFGDIGDKTTTSFLDLKLHKNIPSLSTVQPQFGTIQELRSTGSELAPIVEKNLSRAMEILPDIFSFSELTPDQLQKIVNDMELFISPEERKKNLIALYDYIEAMRRRGYLNLTDDVIKKFKRMSEQRVIDDESTEFLNSTIETVFRTILGGMGVHKLIQRNIGINPDDLAEFITKMNKPFSANGIPSDYQKMAPERSKNVGQIICLMRLLDSTQSIYTERLKQIVPYYRSSTTEILRFYAELELKLAKQGMSIKNFFHGESGKQLEQSIVIIRSIDGNMESFGRITPKQEQLLKEKIFTFQQDIQSLIDAYEQFETIVVEEYKRIPGDAQSAFVEIMTRLYDRGTTARSSNIGAAGAQRFPLIDSFVAQVTNTRKATYISQGREAVRMCIENPELMTPENCPKSFRELVMLYVK